MIDYQILAGQLEAAQDARLDGEQVEPQPHQEKPVGAQPVGQLEAVFQQQKSSHVVGVDGKVVDLGEPPLQHPGFGRVIHLSLIHIYASQSWQVVMLALLALAAWLGWRRPHWRLRLGLCAGSVLGVWLFLLLWEAGQRYIINCVPLLAVLMGAAVSGFVQIRLQRPP